MRRALLPLLALASLAGCGGPKELSIDGAWVRLPAVPDRPGAAYFTIHGGPADARLIDVSSDVAIGSEMHESMTGGGTGAGGVASMKPIAAVAIPARGEERFRPGGRHVMLFHINPGVKPSGRMKLIFAFADGSRIEADAPVLAAGDPAPG